MAHIKVPDNLAGILGRMAIGPESTKALRELVEILLHGPNPLSSAERDASGTGQTPTELNRPLPELLRFAKQWAGPK
jgi:hypothetical protein